MHLFNIFFSGVFVFARNFCFVCSCWIYCIINMYVYIYLIFFYHIFLLFLNHYKSAFKLSIRREFLLFPQITSTNFIFKEYPINSYIFAHVFCADTLINNWARNSLTEVSVKQLLLNCRHIQEVGRGGHWVTLGGSDIGIAKDLWRPH